MTPVTENKAKPVICGSSQNGDYVKTVTICASDGMTASVLTLGARLIDLRLSDNRPLTLSFDDLKQVEDDNAYVGVAVGRTANRIREGRLLRHESIDEHAFLEKNENGRHHCHGGTKAWDKRLFAVTRSSDSAVELFMFSPDGDQGYPSSVNVSVRYELTGTGQLVVALTTTNVGSTQTITNMTLHPYFDLTGRGGMVQNSVLDYVVHAPNCSRYLVLDSDNIPTGEIASVQGTRFDFSLSRKLHDCAQSFPGYDHYFVANDKRSEEAPLKSLVTVTAPRGDQGSAIQMEVSSDQPGFQMYTANGFDGNRSSSFARCGSIAIEPSGFIDAPNNPAFPTVVLDPNQTRRQVIVYAFRRTEVRPGNKYTTEVTKASLA